MPHLVANEILIPEIASLLSEGREVLFTPTGCSMRPFIEGGRDTVLLTAPKKVRVGDVCLARIPLAGGGYTFVLHRVIKVCGTQVTLQGDGNLSGEEHCPLSDVLGSVVVARSPRGCRKPLTRGWFWRYICRPRRLWLKLYRHTLLKLY
ncbi:MAG: S24/S26 family peptidase [Paludibacteraceae bacterium]|nr:S24/S26 family peptidase [Paludibacteraceae bacterium]